MKIKIDRKVLAQALSETVPFAPAKPTIAILKNAKITTKGNRLKIEANDTQCSVVKYIETIECDQDGSFLIDIFDLNKFLAKVKSQIIEISVNANSVLIKHDKGTAEFQTENADEYPTFRMPNTDPTSITLPASLIGKAVFNGKGFVSTETLRPVMCAIYAFIEDGEFGYCASDTHKLIYGHEKVDCGNVDNVHWFIMPSVMSPLINMCKVCDSVSIQITESHVQYRIGNTIIQTIQAKGAYPAFKRIIPQSWGTECSVAKIDMLDVLSRVSLFCSASQCIKMAINPMDMVISVDNLDMMKKSIETVAHNGCASNMTLGVNVNHLTSAISVLPSEEIILGMESESKPISILQPENNGLHIVVMPMSLMS